MEERVPARVFLVGMPACGKSTCGQQLAGLIGWQWLDLDVAVSSMAGMSVQELFAKQGEATFRQWEQKALHQVISQGERIVVATGGGAPCFFDNMDVMCREGLTVFMHVPTEVLCERIARRRHSRPMFSQLNDEQILAELEHKQAQRIPFYRKAHIEVHRRQIDAHDILAAWMSSPFSPLLLR